MFGCVFFSGKKWKPSVLRHSPVFIFLGKTDSKGEALISHPFRQIKYKGYQMPATVFSLFSRSSQRFVLVIEL